MIVSCISRKLAPIGCSVIMNFYLSLSRLKNLAMFLDVFLILDIMVRKRLRCVVDDVVVSSSSYVVIEIVNISDEDESLGVEVLGFVHFNICFPCWGWLGLDV